MNLENERLNLEVQINDRIVELISQNNNMIFNFPNVETYNLAYLVNSQKLNCRIFGIGNSESAITKYLIITGEQSSQLIEGSNFIESLNKVINNNGPLPTIQDLQLFHKIVSKL